MHEEPQKEHQWLTRLVGEWEVVTQGTMGPDTPPFEMRGTDSVRTLGGLWVLCEGRADHLEGPPHTSMMTLGYDPNRKRFVGTFVASMMTYLWTYEGELDASQNKLTLNAEGPSMATPGSLAKYQDIIEWVDENQRTLSSQVLMPDGTWFSFMKATYRRIG
jgi:hypothetical protein